MKKSAPPNSFAKVPQKSKNNDEYSAGMFQASKMSSAKMFKKK